MTAAIVPFPIGRRMDVVSAVARASHSRSAKSIIARLRKGYVAEMVAAGIPGALIERQTATFDAMAFVILRNRAWEAKAK